MKGPILLYKIGLGHVVGNMVLLLTTTGRKTGLSRVTPLQYERIDGEYYVAAARGKKADWIRNLIADPNVKIQVKNHHHIGIARLIIHRPQVINFLNLRIKRHPRMMRMMLRAEGLKFPITDEKIKEFAKNIVLVKIVTQRTGS